MKDSGSRFHTLAVDRLKLTQIFIGPKRCNKKTTKQLRRRMTPNSNSLIR